jgi:plasmid stability protein
MARCTRAPSRSSREPSLGALSVCCFERPLGIYMGLACYHAISMSSMIQIRNVPDALHRELKVRAAQTGMTLSDYLLVELRALAVRPTMREWLARSEAWAPVEASESPAAVIAAERERTAA